EVTSSGLLLRPAVSNSLQKIHLIGHSRGAAVNAGVSEALARIGYRNVIQVTDLDGFSTDWPNGTGSIGDISIVKGTIVADGGRKVNYRVQESLVGWILNDLLKTNWASKLAGGFLFSDEDKEVLRGLDVRAPSRAADDFEDYMLMGAAEPSQHL